MTACGLLLDDRFLDHVPAAGHPERPERLRAISDGLGEVGLIERLQFVPARPARDDELLRVHAEPYLQRLHAACVEHRPFIDCADSSICPDSERIARLAAGGVIDAALQVARGELRSAFCAVRPPGHHAEYGESMGFCLYNNIALAARALQHDLGMERILILDWDVHHGNGTQHAFQSEDAVLFISLHGHPDYLYPYMGYADERGLGRGRGFTVNLPFLPGAGDVEYRQAFDEIIEPRVESYRPRMVLISAGFDAHVDDPLGITALSDSMFAWMTRRVRGWAEAHGEGRVVSVLEGGYNLDVLRRCTAEHVQLLADL